MSQRIPRKSDLADIAERRWSQWATQQAEREQLEQSKSPERRASEWATAQELAEQAGSNTGTIDPAVIPLLRGAARLGELASEPEHYKHGYLDGHRAGVWQALFLGFMLGAAVVGIFVQLGATAGGWP